MITHLHKVVRVGTRKDVGRVYVKIEYRDGRLSLTGVEGPLRGGYARGGCGQIEMSYKHRFDMDDDPRTPRDALTTPSTFTKWAPGWSAERWLDLLDDWHRWHLNDMRAGCAHQRAAHWGAEQVEVVTYGLTHEVRKRETKGAGWVHEHEHPRGVLAKPCPECGYKYGTAWLREDVPADVLRRLADLPDADVPPPW